MSFPVFNFSHKSSLEEFNLNKDLLQNYFKKQVHELKIDERKEINTDNIELRIKSDASSNHFILQLQNYKYLQKHKIFITISVLNVKNHQIILKIEKSTNNYNEINYLLLGRYKPLKLKSLFIHKLSTNFCNNFTKIYKNIFLNFSNFTQISLNTLLIPDVPNGIMLCYLQYYYKLRYNEQIKSITTFYYTIHHVCSLDYNGGALIYYRNDEKKTGFIYRNKTIKIDNCTFIFDWLIELNDKSQFVFGKMSGSGSSIFPLKNVMYWSKLQFIQEFKNCVTL
ncbi:hypothetical protein ABK040_001508 [Willaertia magna]